MMKLKGLAPNSSAPLTGEAKRQGVGFVPGPVFGAKQDDPLIKAETEKKVNEQKGVIEMQYRNSIEEIDKHFELRKKELMI
jgi:hypothetical protein